MSADKPRFPHTRKRKITAIAACFIVMLVLHLTSHHWWWVMAAPFLCAAPMSSSGRQGFMIGMTSGGLLWLSGAAYAWITGADAIVARVAMMMGVGLPWTVLFATVLLALVAAGFAGVAGYYARAVFRLRRSRD